MGRSDGADEQRALTMTAHTQGVIREVRTTMVTLKTLIGACTLVLVAYATVAAQSATGDTDRARAQAELIRSRQAIFTMEAILQQAVLSGAEMVMAQVRTVMPTGRPSLANTPRVGGVRLAGFGVLFTVQVPDFDLPIMWDLVVRPNQNREASVAMMVQQMKTQLMGMPSGPARAQLLDQVYQLEMQLASGAARAEPRGITAASIRPEGIERRAENRVDPKVVEDPVGEYTRQVKDKLIEAMLVNSQALSIAPDEYLVIVATDDTPTRVPGDSIDDTTWVMRVKGSVLTSFRAGTITKEEAEKQVEVTEQ